MINSGRSDKRPQRRGRHAKLNEGEKFTFFALLEKNDGRQEFEGNSALALAQNA